MEFKSDGTIDVNSRDTPRAYVGGRLGAESVLTPITLRTALGTRKLDA
jgi:hypothetical protein